MKKLANNFRFVARKTHAPLWRTLSGDADEIQRNFPSLVSFDLEDSFIRPHIYSIEQLPEISKALESRKNAEPVRIDEIERATKVFSSIQPGCHEHKASLALLAECQDPVHAMKTMTNLKQYTTCADEEFSLEISLAKALWLNGEFGKAETLCSDLLQNNALVDSLPAVHIASARTGQAISRLCRAQSIDDVYSVRDPFRIAMKSLDKIPSPALALAQLNFGTAEAIYAQIVAREQELDVPLDRAMRAWKEGLTTLKRVKGGSYLCYTIQAQLYTQMAWGMLQMEHEKDKEKRASEFARDALKIYDDHGGPGPEGLRRTLGMIGTCLHKTSSAVTAEGIFKSAVDNMGKPINILEKIQLRDNMEAYASLCRDWEKRERDSDRLRALAAELDTSLPAGWKGKPGVYSSLWFWTPSLLRHR
jgi:hypothetical protein